ncbi:hypothetical protein [Streptomyces sp. DH8]|uniref:hypothetical protein n=1 Tax=Streptomyces sp. DH8 TaxID=2857008 RepID=UPI001E6449C9|nr:hypothetical protein [Streptomyces sp. DH8]
MERLKAEARSVHRQLAPLWTRKVHGQRLRSLDFDLGSDWTLHDLVASGPDPYEAFFGALPDDPRLASVLSRLNRAERAVALSWSHLTVTSWAEAAADAIAAAPEQFVQFARITPVSLGERVRRKLKRLGDAERAER